LQVRIALLLPALLAPGAPAQSLSLNDLVAEALVRNPEILAAQKTYEAARQKPRQESALPDPMFSLGYNSTGSPRPFAGIGTDPVANAGVMFTQEFPYPGKRRLRGNIATKEAEAEFQQYQAVQLSVLSRLKQAYFRLQHSHAMQGVLERNRDLLRKLLSIAEIRYSVAKAMQQDVLKTQTQLSLIETRLIQLQRDQRAREAELNALVARPLDTAVAKPDDPDAAHIPVTLEELHAAAEENAPMIRRDEKMIQRNELAVNLAKKDVYPDFTLTGGYYNMGSMPDMYMFRADIKLPLYWLRKQRAGVAQQSHELAASKKTLEATVRSLQFRIKDDYLMAQTSLQLMNLYSKTVIPQANLTFESALSSYETGISGFDMALMNYMTATEYEMNYHEEMLSYHLALARLEEMTGKELIHQ
jgi:outer membrane protein TolC